MNIFLVRLEKLERPKKIEAATKIYLTILNKRYSSSVLNMNGNLRKS